MGVSAMDRTGGDDRTGNNDNDLEGNCPAPTSGAPGIGPDEHEHANNLYTAHRDYIVHEDDLVNQRTTWAITIESFVIAIFGLAYQKKMEGLLAFFGLDEDKKSFSVEVMKTFDHVFDQFLIMIAVFGLIVAMISGVAVYAAQRAIKVLGEHWEAECSTTPLCGRFPPLTGGGNKLSTRLGHTFPLILPIFFVAFWLFTIIFIAWFQKGLMLEHIHIVPP